MRTVFFLVLFVLLVSALLHHNPLESLLFAVALAVGLTPEFLPMIIAVTLSRGAVRMARQKVIVKHLAAIQNFGSMDILCSDKTGTLTSGDMVLDRHLDPFGQLSERPLDRSPTSTARTRPVSRVRWTRRFSSAAGSRATGTARSTRFRSTSSAGASRSSSRTAANVC